MRPVFIPNTVRKYYQTDQLPLPGLIRDIALKFKRLLCDEPEVSIVIPAYNEEDNILKMLASLSDSSTNKKLEIIVVNNNSSDSTGEIAKATGVICIDESQQGITAARNAGLSKAKGGYIINADADTIYPPDWIDHMVNPLIQYADVALTYGRFAFIPIKKTPRPLYFLFEYMSDFNRLINKKFREEALNVYGFNSACRRDQCVLVGGFDHPEGTNEDGWLAIKLRDKGFGKLFWVTDVKSIVWTTDRRIQIDGGFVKATISRLRKYVR